MNSNSQIIIQAGHIIQAVHYDLNVAYPDVVSVFQQHAEQLLGVIPGTGLIITLPLADPRHHKVAVAGKSPSPGSNRITKITVWQNTAAREAYLQHPNLISWCEWVLNGWRLRGSDKDTLIKRRREFVDAVLSGSSTPSEWAEDLEVPDTERPWLGEVLSLSTVVGVGATE